MSARRLVRSPILRLACALPWLVSCGNDDGASAGIDACGAASSGREAAPGVHARKIIFTVSNYRDATALCAFEPAQGALREVAVARPDSNDWLVLRDATDSSLLVVERFSGKLRKPTRITRYEPSLSQIVGEGGAFPGNVQDLLVTRAGKLLSVGFDDAGVSLGEPGLARGGVSLRASAPVAGLPSPTSNPDAQFSLALEAQGRTFVLTVGYDIAGASGPKQALVHLLSRDLAKVESSVPVKDPVSGVTCLNASARIKVSASEAVVACNAQYGDAPPSASAVQDVAVFRVALAGGKPTFSALASARTDSVSRFIVGGMSADGAWALVREVGWKPNAALVERWLPARESGGVPRPAAASYGGEFAWHASTKSYVFACARDAKAACKAKTFVVVPEAALFTGVGKREFGVPHLGNFVGFEAPLFHAR